MPARFARQPKCRRCRVRLAGRLAFLLFSVVLGCTRCAAPAKEAPEPAAATEKVTQIRPLPLAGEAKEKKDVLVLRLEGHVDEATPIAVAGSLALAKKVGADAVVLEINTRGGSVDAGFLVA